MRISLALIFAYMFLPFVGLLTFLDYDKQVFGDVSDVLIYSNLIHNLILSFFILTTVLFIKKKNVSFCKDILDNNMVKNKLNKSLFVLSITFIIVFFIGGYSVIMGVPRGEIRITLGALGPLYTLLNVYLTPCIVTYSTILYLMSYRSSSNKYKLFICYLIAFVIGLLTGFKYAAILIILPGIIHLNQMFKVKHFIFIGTTFMISMTLSASFVMKNNLENAFSYVLARATSVASYGQVAIWNYLPNGARDSSNSFFRFFGNNITTSLTGARSNTVDFLQYNMARYITYLSYPNTKGAISGEVNLTITTFGESVYHFGRDYFFIYSFFVGFISASCIYLMYFRRTKDFIIFNSVFSVYFTTVFLQWIANGDITSLFQLPRLIYFILIYLVLRFIDCNVIFGKIKSI